MPMMWGMRSLPMMMGAKRMMSSTTKNINVGSVIGKYWAMFSMGMCLFVIRVQKYE